MKIRAKLVTQYTLVTIAILTAVFAFVYVLTSRTIDKNYYSILSEKAFTTAHKHFEQDEVSQRAYQIILENYRKVLPEAIEVLFNANNEHHLKDSLNIYLSNDEIGTLLNKTKVLFKYNDLNGVAIYYPDNEGDFIVIVMASNTQGEYIKKELLAILFTVLFLSSALVFALSWWNATLISRPLQVLASKTQEIGANQLHIRIKEPKGKDEIAQLVRFFNLMLERLEFSFASQKAFIANASHELNNPLTAIIGECDVMQLKDYNSKEYKKAIERIQEESFKLKELVKHLLRLAQTDLDISESTLVEINIEKELIAIAQHFELSKYQGRVYLHLDKIDNAQPFIIKANQSLMFIALQNIVENACKYSDQKVSVSLETNSKYKRITIEDKGIGIPTKDLNKIFEAFFRAQNTYQYAGYGIGLSLVEKIVGQTKGKINVCSEENRGTRFSITWKT
ncbi:two-component sensor histidine kinase [Bacteroidales bacterium]|nr:two-component sensor histidine kinase [Bacteroidales bacterium]